MQIYFDFSGYSDMAIGMGRMLGFRFAENFNYPYISRSITEFWRRWHISLSTWFRDYVYIPLGGNRKGGPRTYFHLWLVFFLCGLWHGASWTFVVWGIFHGLLLVGERFARAHLSLESRLWVPLKHLYVVLMVMIGWVIFRAESFGQAIDFLQAMAGFGAADGLRFYPALYLGTELKILCAVAVIASCPLAPYLRTLIDAAGTQPLYPRRVLRLGIEVGTVGVLTALLLFSAMKLAVTTHNPFIYFRF